MGRYNVEFFNSAAKEFRALPSDIKSRVGEAIDALEQNPRPQGVRKLSGHTNLYRIRVGVYRVVYEINDRDLLVRITRVRHRREAYR
ncbi:MAG: type II toxin-antitoxin system RelE family toxin [bacterium]